MVMVVVVVAFRDGNDGDVMVVDCSLRRRRMLGLQWY